MSTNPHEGRDGWIRLGQTGANEIQNALIGSHEHLGVALPFGPPKVGWDLWVDERVGAAEFSADPARELANMLSMTTSRHMRCPRQRRLVRNGLSNACSH